MNISNLELNVKYKNYKKLCEILGEEIKTSNSKKAQLKEWSRYFKYHKDGNEFIITEIYPEPLKKIDNRKGHSGTSEGSRNHNNKYGKYLDVLIENLLFKQKKKGKGIVYITNSCIAQMVKMVNFNYRTCVNNRDQFHKYIFSKYDYSTKEAENDVINCIYAKIRPAITSALNRLQKQGKITYKATYITYRKFKSIAVTKQENKNIIAIENSILNKMGITRKQMMWNNKKRKQFYDKVNAEIIEYFQNKGEKIDGIYQGYQIFNMKNLKQQKDIKTLEKEFNNLFAKDIMDSIQKNIEKIKQKYSDYWGNPHYNYWDQNRMGLKYLETCKHIIKILISYKTNNITEIITNIEIQNKNKFIDLFG